MTGDGTLGTDFADICKVYRAGGIDVAGYGVTDCGGGVASGAHLSSG